MTEFTWAIVSHAGRATTIFYGKTDAMQIFLNRRILAARDKKTKNSDGLRFFKLSKLNFEAADYIDLIDWSNCVVTEPPLTMRLKDKDLKEMCKEEQFPVLTFEEFPYHKHPVERCVNLISEAAMNICGEGRC
ncbi:hypothetical protein AVEN_119972-1 [Araneus ventricosus]|uniref:Uncharacterized protein n=1 Tax=Araneus ventricosus TaxID=182803 RepID=A0A4Y2Q933_ARAVE|nr:hypothetical protein AVEN_119972-1 [Araneus ventricosus]